MPLVFASVFRVEKVLFQGVWFALGTDGGDAVGSGRRDVRAAMRKCQQTNLTQELGDTPLGHRRIAAVS